MPRCKPSNDDQDAMVVINYRHQLQPGTFSALVMQYSGSMTVRVMLNEMLRVNVVELLP